MLALYNSVQDNPLFKLETRYTFKELIANLKNEAVNIEKDHIQKLKQKLKSTEIGIAIIYYNVSLIEHFRQTSYKLKMKKMQK